MVAKSKNDYLGVVSTAISVYDKILQSAAIPQGVKNKLNENSWIKDGLGKLEVALNKNEIFYIPSTTPSGSTWTGTSSSHAFGVNMAKVFNPGQFALDKLIELETGKTDTPQFYGYNDGSAATKITSKDQINTFKDIGFKFLVAPVKEAVPGAFDDLNQDADIFSPEIGAILYDLYHK
jgi:hypothetical protein